MANNEQVEIQTILETLPKLPLLYEAQRPKKCNVQRNVAYKRSGDKDLLLDIYAPADLEQGAARPVVIHVSGGGETKHWRLFEDYGTATAAHGMIGVEFNKRYWPGVGGVPEAMADIADLLTFLRQNAAHFNIDPNRICLWTFSGGGRLLTAGMQPEQPFIRCLVSYYGLHDDKVRQQLKAIAGKLPPFLLARMGLDTQELNATISDFVSVALKQNERVEIINYEEGRHAFDIYDDTTRTREIICRTFQFIEEQTKR